jgi:hypothetical protein
MALNRWGSRLCSLSFALVLLGCGETDFGFFPTRPPQPFDEVKKEISRLRGLPFVHEVTLETKKLEEIGSLLAEPDGNATEEKSSLMAEIYTRLGLLTEAADLSKDLVELQRFRHSIHYDARRRKIVVPQEPLKPDLAFLRFPGRTSEETTKQLLLAHALAHALQDQHFQWRARIKSRNTTDSRLTLRAVTQGDAVLVGLAYLAARERGDKEEIIDAVKNLLRLSTALERGLSFLPELLRQKLAFEYLYGSQFVLWAYSHKTAQAPQAPPTLQEAIRMLARLGGYKQWKKNQLPGPLTLAKGLAILSAITDMWRIMNNNETMTEMFC